VIATAISCQGSEFSGGSSNRAAAQKPQKPALGSDDATPGKSDKIPSGDEMKTDDGGLILIAPKICDASNIKFIIGAGQCPAGSAAYAADDSRSAALACCPLPALDIIASGAPASRGGQCGPDEVAVGVNGNSLLCAPINKTRYALKPQTATCYYGSGASGGAGSAKCLAPSPVLLAMAQPYGTDACLPVPYGALITARTDKYCRNVQASQLVFKADAAPVPMFK
jgi:hypothetical protein